MTAIAIDDHVVWTLAKLSFDKLEQMLKGRGGGEHDECRTAGGE